MKTKQFIFAILALTVVIVSSCSKESTESDVYEIQSLDKKEVKNMDV